MRLARYAVILAILAVAAGTAGRYDRYSNDARYVYEAAATVNRRDIVAALQQPLTAQMKLWWDRVSPKRPMKGRR
jgi:hypothetical protein